MDVQGTIPLCSEAIGTHSTLKGCHTHMHKLREQASVCEWSGYKVYCIRHMEASSKHSESTSLQQQR